MKLDVVILSVKKDVENDSGKCIIPVLSKHCPNINSILHDLSESTRVYSARNYLLLDTSSSSSSESISNAPSQQQQIASTQDQANQKQEPQRTNSTTNKKQQQQQQQEPRDANCIVPEGACEENPLMTTIGKQILKYVKASDRYLSLASFLLKSRAFHETYSPLPSEPKQQLPEKKLPLIELPRTKHGKPYIPIRVSHNTTTNTQNNNNCHNNSNHALAMRANTNPNNINNVINSNLKSEENKYPLSVSHQYPYVGMIRIHARDTVEQNEETETEKGNSRENNKERIRKRGDKNSKYNNGTASSSISSSISHKIHNNNDIQDHTSNVFMVGFDIVVFDEINYQLYDTVQDYVKVFRDMFSVPEFNYILNNQICQDNPDKQLRELYIRWAMKEAYTKAMGVGLGYDFSTFQVNLNISPERNSSNTSIPPPPVVDRNRNNNNKISKNSSGSWEEESCLIWDWLCSCPPSNIQTFTSTCSNVIDHTNNIGENKDDVSTTTATTSSSSSTSPTSTATMIPTVLGVTGIVHHANEEISSNEIYAFLFFPLLKNTTKTSYSLATDMAGCACACVGPLLGGINTNNSNSPSNAAAAAIAAMKEIECSIEWTDLEQLISWTI